MDQAWFEMPDVIRRWLADAVWVALHPRHESREGEYAFVGHKSEFYGVHTMAVPLSKRADGERISWTDTRWPVADERRIHAARRAGDCRRIPSSPRPSRRPIP
jgi:hypothetical protein